TPSTLVDTAPARQSTIKRVRSLFRKSVNSDNGSPMMSTDPTVPVPPLIHKHLVGLSQHTHVPARPVTPPLQREPSYEDISIFADGNTASALRAGNRNDRLMRASHQTTFTDMMEQTGLAGVTKGQPYIYKEHNKSSSPGRNLTPPRLQSPGMIGKVV
ncbi:hypothetical protein DH86_00000039, partial [Scytalidium sp. 3C]